MDVELDRTRCQGHGRCYMLAPDVFDADDDGYGLVRDREVASNLETAAEKGANNCPEDAIRIS